MKILTANEQLSFFKKTKRFLLFVFFAIFSAILWIYYVRMSKFH